MQHPFLTKEALREGAEIFSGGEDVQPPPGSTIVTAATGKEEEPSVESNAVASATDDEEEGDPQLLANPPKKRTMEEEAMRTTNLLLAREYIDMLKKNGPADLSKSGVRYHRFRITRQAAVQLTDKSILQAILSADETEAIVRVYLQDRSYKSVRVTVENTAEDVTKTLRLKLGKEWCVTKVVNAGNSAL
jgi:hypothetical protein